MSLALESVLRDLRAQPAPPRDYAELREDKQRRRAWALRDMQAEKAQAEAKAAAAAATHLHPSPHEPQRQTANVSGQPRASYSHAPSSAASSAQRAFRPNVNSQSALAATQATQSAKSRSSHKRRLEQTDSPAPPDASSSFEFAFEFPSDAEIAAAAAAAPAGRAPIKLNRGRSSGDSMDDDPAVTATAAASSSSSQPVLRSQPWSPQLLPTTNLQFVPMAVLPAAAITSAASSSQTAVDENRPPRMSVHSAADVTLVLVAHFLPCADLLRFSRCDWRLRELSYASHVWKHARWELNDARYETRALQFSVHAVHPDSSLRHVPVHLVASPHPTVDRVLSALDSCLSVTSLDLSQHSRRPPEETARIFDHPVVRAKLRSVQFHSHDKEAFDARILSSLLPLQSLTDVQLRPLLVTNAQQYACLADLPSLRRLTLHMHHALESIVAQCVGLRFLRLFHARLNSLNTILPSLPQLDELQLVSSLLLSTDVDWQSLGAVRSLTLEACPHVRGILERLKRIAAANNCLLTSLCIQPHVTELHALKQEPTVDSLLPICTALPRLDVLLLLRPVKERRFTGDSEMAVVTAALARFTAIASDMAAQGCARITVRSTSVRWLAGVVRRTILSMSQSDAAGATALLAFSASASVPRLTRLPAVLVHLVMQCLPLASLAHLSSTCRLLRSEALHPSAGRFLGLVASGRHEVSLETPSSIDLSKNSRYFPGCEEVRAQRATYSPLGRAHLAVALFACLTLEEPLPHLEGLSESELVAALIVHAAGWKHVKAIRLWSAERWTVKDALSLLQAPALQRVSSVENAAGVWLCEAVQTAMCRLPLLSGLEIGSTDEHHPALRLHPSALAQAQSLRSIRIAEAGVPLYELAGLACVPQLWSLHLEFQRDRYERVNHAERLVPRLLQCRSAALSHLRVLRMDNCNLTPLSRAELCRFFRAMPRLAFLGTSAFAPNVVLRSLMDAGVASLPDLRVVRFWTEGGDSLSRLRLRAFLAAFPLVRYCYAREGDGDEHAYSVAEFALWPRVCTEAEHAEPSSDGHCVCPITPASTGGLSFKGSKFTSFDAAPPLSADALTAAESASWRLFTPAAPAGAASYWYNSKNNQQTSHNPSLTLEESEAAATAASVAQPMPTLEDSLRQLQLEYDAVLAQWGPWQEP